MYADTLLDAERSHLLRLVLWGGASVLLGTVLLLVIALRRLRSPLPLHFGIQTAAWGAVTLALAMLRWRGLALRDFDGARRLLRMLWLGMGLEAALVAVGATLAIGGWAMGRRLGVVGTGLALVVHWLALLALDARFVMFLERAIP